MKLIVKLTADELMNVVDAVKEEADYQGFLYDGFADEQTEGLLKVLDTALDAAGIEIVEEDSFDNDDEDEWGDDFDEEEEVEESSYEDKYPGLASIVYELNGKRVISQSDAISIMRSIIKSVDEFCPDASIDQKKALQKEVFTKFSHDFGFEGVDMSE